MTYSEREGEITFAKKTDVLRYLHVSGVTNGSIRHVSEKNIH